MRLNNLSRFFVATNLLILFLSNPASRAQSINKGGNNRFRTHTNSSKREAQVPTEFSTFLDHISSLHGKVSNTNKSSSTRSGRNRNSPTSASSFRGISRESFIKEIRKYDSCSYVYGNEGPNSFDCSGFVWYILVKKFQCVNSTRFSTDSIRALFPSRPSKSCKPGDIVYRSGHVSFYLAPGLTFGAIGKRWGVGEQKWSGVCLKNPCFKD